MNMRIVVYLHFFGACCPKFVLICLLLCGGDCLPLLSVRCVVKVNVECKRIADNNSGFIVLLQRCLWHFPVNMTSR